MLAAGAGGPLIHADGHLLPSHGAGWCHELPQEHRSRTEARWPAGSGARTCGRLLRRLL